MGNGWLSWHVCSSLEGFLWQDSNSLVRSWLQLWDKETDSCYSKCQYQRENLTSWLCSGNKYVFSGSLPGKLRGKITRCLITGNPVPQKFSLRGPDHRILIEFRMLGRKELENMAANEFFIIEKCKEKRKTLFTASGLYRRIVGSLAFI